MSDFHYDLYISADGSYGTDKIMLLNTENWTDEDWQTFEEASDNEKWATAQKIEEKNNV